MKTMDSVLKKTGYFRSFDGEMIYFEQRGEGNPLILCYGIGCLFNHWAPQVHFFSKTHQVSMVDYRGHQKTAIPENKETLSISSLARDLIEYCEQNKIKKADFVGHSFGGQVLLELYKKAPHLLKSLSLINGFYHNPFSHIMSADHILEMIDQSKRLYNQIPKVISALWQKSTTNPLFLLLSSLTGGFNLSKTALKDIEIYTKGLSTMDFRVFFTFFEEMIAFNGEESLGDLAIPTLLICGSKDALTPMADQERMHQMIPSSLLFPVPYGSHCAHLDFPEIVNLKIQNFIHSKGP